MGGGRLVVMIVAVLCAGLAATGCATGELDATAAFEESLKPNSALREAQLQFREGNFGKSIDAYRAIVEADTLNAEAWLGLAASYDEIHRFDLADESYNRVVSLIGETPAVLNNLGYSYYLRGDLETARTKLTAAHGLAPDNPYILNNINILNRKLVSLGAAPMPL